MDNMISDLFGTAAYLGDIIAVGRSEDELPDRINQLLSRIQEYGFRLRAEKCHFFYDPLSTLSSFSIRTAVVRIRRMCAQFLICLPQLMYQTSAHFWGWPNITVHVCLLWMR